MNDIIERDLSAMIEKVKLENEELTYLECIVVVSNRIGVQIEDVAPLLSKNIREKVEYEANKLNLLKEKMFTLC